MTTDPTTEPLRFAYRVPNVSGGLVTGTIEQHTALVGWLTLILSFTTCTIPGFLLLLGEWGHVGTWLVLVVMAATVVAVAPLAVRSLRQPAEVPGPAEAGASVPVSVP